MPIPAANQAEKQSSAKEKVYRQVARWIIDGTMVNPVMAHKRELKVEPGEIVPVDIEIVPTARIYHKGEKLRIQIAGRYIREGWFEPLAWDTDNHGNQIIYTGGKYESFIQCPVIPPKYRAGEYVYR